MAALQDLKLPVAELADQTVYVSAGKPILRMVAVDVIEPTRILDKYE